MEKFLALLEKYPKIIVMAPCEFNGCWSISWIVNEGYMNPFPIKGFLTYSPRGYEIGLYNITIKDQNEALELFAKMLEIIDKYSK